MYLNEDLFEEYLDEGKNSEYLENDELGIAIRSIARAIADGKALNDDEQKVYYALRDAVIKFRNKTESLKEDFEDVVDIEIPVLNMDTEEIDSSDMIPEGPEVGIDIGIADLLLNLINGENDTIRDYNTFKANLGKYGEFASVIDDITNEEMNHVGMLQTLLKKISPNAETIKEGEVEAEELLKDENKEEEIIVEPTSDIDLTTDLVDDVDDDFLALYIPEAISKSSYTPFDRWDEEDIIKHQSIDWAGRNYEDYEDDSEEFKSEVVAYGFGKPIKKIVTMHKFFRANPIYPPYYKAIEEPFEGVVGPMYDGNKHGNYDIHDRYETQDVYNMLSN